MKPTISCQRAPMREGRIYNLFISDKWLADCCWPRLALTWWFIKMAWHNRKYL